MMMFPSTQFLGCSIDCFDIETLRELKYPSRLIRAHSNNAQKFGIVCAAIPLLELAAHRSHGRGVATAWTRDRTTLCRSFESWIVNSSVWFCLVYPRIALLDDDPQVDALSRFLRNQLQSHTTVSFSRKPERSRDWHFCTAAGAFALDGTRPDIGDWHRALGVFGIELGKLFFRFASDPFAPIFGLRQRDAART